MSSDYSIGDVDTKGYTGTYELPHWQYEQVFAPPEVAAWECAIHDLRMLLRILEQADIHDPEDMAEVEEIIDNELPRLPESIADAFDTLQNHE